MTTTLTGHVVGIGFGRLDPDADEDNAWIDDGHTYVTVRLDDDDATVSGGHTTITWDDPTAERMGTERPGVENADTGDISAEPSEAEIQAAARALSAFDGTNWDSLRTRGRETYSNAARAALVAARKVTAPPPSEPIVEAAAQAMSDSDRPAHGLTPEWDQREPEERNRYRALAHVAIRTARGEGSE